MAFKPELEGTASIRSSLDAFFRAFQRRVTRGLLTGRPHPRSNYVVTEAGPARLEVRADGWWTAINVGLNWLELRPSSPGVIRYHVRYWQWARFALFLCGSLGLMGLVLLLGFDLRGYIVRHRSSMFPGLSIDQNRLIAWSMVVFWGFIWPWLLIEWHKRPVHGLVARLIAEVDTEAQSAPPT